MIKLLVQKYRNLILYGLIGGTCALLDFIVYSGLCNLISFLVANVISTHCGIFCSFFLNRKYNFKVEDNTLRRFFSFYTVGLLGLAVSEGLLFLMVNYFGIEKIVSKLITVVAVALLQFVLNKFITFKTKKNG